MKVGRLINLIIFAVFLILIVNANPTSGEEGSNLNRGNLKHLHREAEYQCAWCNAHNGIIEFKNEDKTRVDCLTTTHAVEFDFWNKWAESIGQALHYGAMTGKRPKIVLILENPEVQMSYYNRIEKLSKIYNFDVEYVTPDILIQKQSRFEEIR